MVPKQRKAGQTGGDGHRANRRAARAAGGSVKPPSGGCPLVILAAVIIPAGIVGIINHII